MPDPDPLRRNIPQKVSVEAGATCFTPGVMTIMVAPGRGHESIAEGLAVGDSLRLAVFGVADGLAVGADVGDSLGLAVLGVADLVLDG